MGMEAQAAVVEQDEFIAARSQFEILANRLALGLAPAAVADRPMAAALVEAAIRAVRG